MIDCNTLKQKLDLVKREWDLMDELYFSTAGGIDIYKLYGQDFNHLTPDKAIIALLSKSLNDEKDVIYNWCFKYDFGKLIYEDGTTKSLKDIYIELTKWIN